MMFFNLRSQDGKQGSIVATGTMLLTKNDPGVLISNCTGLRFDALNIQGTRNRFGASWAALRFIWSGPIIGGASTGLEVDGA